MKNNFAKFYLIAVIFFYGCSKNSLDGPSDTGLTTDASTYSSTSGSSSNIGTPNKPGVITSGEWNDLTNWTFWETIIAKDDFKSKPTYWSFYNQNRISVNVLGTDSKPLINATVHLKRNGSIIYQARTDNFGNAELWPDLFENVPNVDFSKLTIEVNGAANVIKDVKSFKNGTNKITIPSIPFSNKVEIAFVVDATGSMGDELNYLKTELLDVINRAKSDNPTFSIATSSVFYRDKGDEYVTRVSNFSNDINNTLNFIKAQNAGGGGDFPEAVHSALDKAVNELQWSTDAKTKIMFLILDAPPHHETQIINDIQTYTRKAAENGIKIIPITASGIDKETEFLMRFLSLSTNGSYVFITNHSGIGNTHLEATVGTYQVEFLNDLMVRLINKYAK